MLPKLFAKIQKLVNFPHTKYLKIIQIFELTKLSMKQGLKVAKPFAFKLVEAFKSNHPIVILASKNNGLFQ
jgi:hypothetical protein